MEDPLKIVEALMARIEPQEICKLYEIDQITSLNALLGQVSRKNGFLKMGGAPNFDQAARRIIRDYLDGKMQYFTPAPHVEGADEMDIEEFT